MSKYDYAGRFPDLYATQFPPVTNYDYETNYYTRGKDNRAFRWQDVYVDSKWIFLEATRSGTFEKNSFRITNSVTGTTGLWYITTGTVANKVSYDPWNLTGSYTVYIPKSGVRLTQDELSGYIGPGFWANPIEGDESIGLYCQDIAIPRIYSNPIPIDPTGIQNDKDHQVYLQAICNNQTGNSPRLKVYLKALNGTSTVGYYDPTSFSGWTLGFPTGYYDVSVGKLTEIKFRFNNANTDYISADSYSLWIETDSTGCFITVDDIHIDQYMEKNPYISGIVPDGYLIQISPDLGWHNKSAMLDQNNDVLNPFVRTFGPYTVSAGNLSDNQDGSVTATIDEADFAAVTTNKYSKYVWRALPLAPNGTVGPESDPEEFEFIGQNINTDFEVTEILNDPLTTVKVIIGKKSSRMKILVDDKEDYPGIEYPTPTSWKLTINVFGQKLGIKVQGKDIGGATSSPQYLELANELYDLKEEQLWNAFDEHGVLMDLRRLPGESNSDYAERIKDVNRSPAGSTYLGLANSSARELGIIKIDDAVSLSTPKNSMGINLHPSVDVEFGSVFFRARTLAMVYTEKLYVDPVYNTINLSKKAYDYPTHIISDNGLSVAISDTEFEIDDDKPSVYRLKIKYPAVFGTFVTVTYPYYEEVLYKDYPTIGDLQEKINSLTDNAGQKLVDCTSSLLLSGGEDCLGLFIGFFALPRDGQISIPWSPIKIRRISDKYFREYFQEDDKSYRETKFYTYITELKSNSRVLWGSVQADRDYWDAADSRNKSFDHIPTLMDPKIAVFTDANIDSAQAWARSYLGNSGEFLSNKGITTDLFQPGVAHTYDLKPGIATVYPKEAIIDDPRLAISQFKLNNNFILFSGQR